MNNFPFDSKGVTLRWALHCCAAILLLPSVLCAAVRRVPEDYATIKAAYAGAQSGDIIEIQPNLYLETPPALFGNPSKPVLFRTASGQAVVAANAPPPNDTFAGRTVLSGVSLTITTDNYSAAVAPEQGIRCPHRTLQTRPTSSVGASG